MHHPGLQWVRQKFKSPPSFDALSVSKSLPPQALSNRMALSNRIVKEDTDQSILATLLFEFTQSDTVNVVAMEGNRLAAGGSNRQVLVYDIGCGLLLHTFNLKETVTTISMCGDLLAAGACHTPAESPLSGRITPAGCTACRIPPLPLLPRRAAVSARMASMAREPWAVCGRLRWRRPEDLGLQPKCGCEGARASATRVGKVGSSRWAPSCRWRRLATSDGVRNTAGASAMGLAIGSDM